MTQTEVLRAKSIVRQKPTRGVVSTFQRGKISFRLRSGDKVQNAVVELLTGGID
jgi:hypothetical protein